MTLISRLFGLFALASASVCTADAQAVYNLSDYGLMPNSKQNASPLFSAALDSIRQLTPEGRGIVIRLEKGRYDFYEPGAAVREYYISNHDQDNPKRVGLPLEQFDNMTLDGQGAELIFHGRMLPVSLVGSKNCTLKNFSIDFETPHIGQAKVLENDTVAGTITFELVPWMKYSIKEGVLYHVGEGWEMNPQGGIAFEEGTKRLVFNTSDLNLGTRDVTELSSRVIRANQWRDARLIPGTVIAMRSWYRPAPGIFMSHDTNTRLENIQIHYAEGMGLLAQMSENITLDGFSVCLRGKDDPRYFTTQADATHFSGCKGRIVSKNGLYEGMMDDAINVHGTYLKVTKRINDNTVRACYMHNQSWGFEWGRPGDVVQFVAARTMELIGQTNRIASIKAMDKPVAHGVREFEITFTEAIDPAISEAATFGIENLEWTPEVEFAHNVVRNNRARGSLFSTPKRVMVKENLFDHTSGTAILLCGDCNGWFETGACREVIIRKNRFVNALTNMFQFTNAVISIYPEIPDLKSQKKYFHSGIVIEDNVFETFDQPIVYAKSVDGLIFRNNKIIQNSDYPAFHWNKHRFLFQRVRNSNIRNNEFDGGFDRKRDLLDEK